MWLVPFHQNKTGRGGARRRVPKTSEPLVPVVHIIFLTVQKYSNDDLMNRIMSALQKDPMFVGLSSPFSGVIAKYCNGPLP